jgi:hypothetical protein
VAQALPCTDIDAEAQTFSVVHGDGQGFPHAFPVRSLANLANDDPLDDRELCLQPYIAKEPDFDAVAFVTPDGGVSVVAMNKGKEALTFSIYDVSLGAGASNVTVPPHSIQSYRLPAAPSAASPAASPAGEPVASPATPTVPTLSASPARKERCMSALISRAKRSTRLSLRSYASHAAARCPVPRQALQS